MTSLRNITTSIREFKGLGINEQHQEDLEAHDKHQQEDRESFIDNPLQPMESTKDSW